MKPEESYPVDFHLHRFFEKGLFKWYRGNFCKAKTDNERRLEANSHKFYRLLSKFGVLFSTKPVRPSVEHGWGYGFFVFSKVDKKNQ